MLEALFGGVVAYIVFMVFMIRRRRKQFGATMGGGNYSNRSWDYGTRFTPGVIGGSFGAGGDYSGGGSCGSDGGSGGSCS
jgi:uncharacterized membrane protein YfcA